MKRIVQLILAAGLLLPLIVLRANPLFMLAGSPPAAGGGGGYDIEENFEGTGYENTWTTAAGSPAPDTSTAGLSLEGSQCLYNNGNAGAVGAYIDFAATDNVYVYGMIRFEDNPSAFRRWMAIKNGTSTLLDGVTGTDGGGQIDIFDIPAGYTVTADSTYHFWVEYEKGTGSNAVYRLYVSTTATKPGSAHKSITNGDSTSQANRLYLETWASGGGNVYFDKIRISFSAPIGSDPE